ncbi:MAG: helix-turn-helix transcriptional regulator [Candidatus Rokuibacteriota bacterium]
MSLAPRPASVPSLAAILADRALLDTLPVATLVELRRQCGYLREDLDAVLTRRLQAQPTMEPARAEPERERLLTPDEAATRLGVKLTWMYRHAGDLPFTRRLGRKTLRFDEAGLQRWQATRRP